MWKILPWTGLACLLMGLGCGIAALVIGLVSDGLPQNSWTLPTGVIQPSVLLSVAATLANAFLRAAFTEGAVIAWWVQAHQGASVETLHASYDHAYTLMGLLTSLFTISKVKVAAIAMFLLLLDGPFLQRASTIEIVTLQDVTKMSIPISPSSFLRGATAFITTHNEWRPDIYTPSFATVAHAYDTRQPMSIPELDNSGTVTMDLVAPGFDVSCINGTSRYRIQTQEQYTILQACMIDGCSEECDITRGPYPTSEEGCIPPTSQPMFKILVEYAKLNHLGSDKEYGINVNASYKSTPTLNGTLTWRNCTLREAVIRYPVQIDNGTVTLRPMPLEENRTEYLIARYYEGEMSYAQPSTIGGLWLALNNQYQTSANVSQTPPYYAVHNENTIANQFFDSGDIESYDVMWNDPLDVIIASAHDLTLRAAINLNNISTADLPTDTQLEANYLNLTTVDRSVSQDVIATIVSTGPLYHTDVAWLICGFLMILIACIAVVPLYWAWWRLERSFTMNPLEVAKAFDAPVLRLANTEISPDAWPQETKSMRIQYGKIAMTEEMESLTGEIKKTQIQSTPIVVIRKFHKID